MYSYPLIFFDRTTGPIKLQNTLIRDIIFSKRDITSHYSFEYFRNTESAVILHQAGKGDVQY